MRPVVLDITRTVSRTIKGRVTGIDRVERAYIGHFLEYPSPVFFFCRIGRHDMVLERDAMATLYRLIGANGPWDRPALTALRPRDGQRRYRIERTVRRLARGHLPQAFAYLNVGHSNLGAGALRKMRRAGAEPLAVLVHDMIPLDFPQFCRPETARMFERKMRSVVALADVVICNSEHTSGRLSHWAATWGKDAPVRQVIPLGTDPLPQPAERPADARPYFVVLGTIEPRKNHRLLLDIWNGFTRTLPAGDIPHLHIIGERGWLNSGVFRTLDSADYMGKTVFEHGNLPDEAVARLLSGARALLFPSFAEGFGYPAIEALQLGTPVVSAPLPSLQELAPRGIIFIDAEDAKTWADTILTITRGAKPEVPAQNFPDWASHFHNVATVISHS